MCEDSADMLEFLEALIFQGFLIGLIFSYQLQYLSNAVMGIPPYKWYDMIGTMLLIMERLKFCGSSHHRGEYGRVLHLGVMVLCPTGTVCSFCRLSAVGTLVSLVTVCCCLVVFY